MGRSADYSKQSCAVAASLHIIGEPWTLLILRDAFGGVSRFEQWQESLGMARNVLAARLKSLVAHDIFAQRLYCERPRRHEYLLTEKGRELRPIILNLMDWGTRHIYGGDVRPRIELVHKGCNHVVEPVTCCVHCQVRLNDEDLVVRRNAHGHSLGQLFRAEPVD